LLSDFHVLDLCFFEVRHHRITVVAQQAEQ
jgi:hypothetical protein